MQYCRFKLYGQVVYGKVEMREGEPWITGPAPIPPEDLTALMAARELPPDGFQPLPLAQAELLVPVTPSKILCVGRNYRDHAKEMGNDIPVEPLLFFKPPSSLLAPGGQVLLPRQSDRVDFEGELALVIGSRIRHYDPANDWRALIRGCTLADDISARDLQKKDGQWTRAKGFDTFCPVGPVVSDELHPEAVLLETRINGELRQSGDTRDFIFSIPQLLAFITAAITLEPGDLLLTGTPAGVGPLKKGDAVEIAVAGLGKLTHSVTAL